MKMVDLTHGALKTFQSCGFEVFVQSQKSQDKFNLL